MPTVDDGGHAWAWLLLAAVLAWAWWGRVGVRVGIRCRGRPWPPRLHLRLAVAAAAVHRTWRFRGPGGGWPAAGRGPAAWRPVLAVLLRGAAVERLWWRTRLGAADPALTAVAAGLVWAVKAAAVGQLSRAVGPLARPPELAVEPVYDRWCLESDLSCIVRLRIRDIMVAAPLAAWLTVRRRLGRAVPALGEPAWSTRSRT